MRRKKTLNFKEMRIIRTVKYIRIEDAAKDWSITFDHKRHEYAILDMFMDREDLSPLETLIYLLYYTNLIITDDTFLNLYCKAIKRFFKIQDKKELKETLEEEEKEILGQEQVLHDNSKKHGK